MDSHVNLLQRIGSLEKHSPLISDAQCSFNHGDLEIKGRANKNRTRSLKGEKMCCSV